MSVLFFYLKKKKIWKYFWEITHNERETFVYSVIKRGSSNAGKNRSHLYTKAAVFTQRLITYHLTFAKIGSSEENERKNIGIVWHEEINGRNADDIISTYLQAKKLLQDNKELIIRADNCTAQNKNWCHYSLVVNILNNQTIVYIPLKNVAAIFFELVKQFFHCWPFTYIN